MSFDSNGPAAPATAPKVVILAPGAEFTANGKRYRVSDTFAIGRLDTVSLFEEEFAQGSEQAGCHGVMLSAMAAINDYKPGEAYVMLYNKVEADQRNRRMMHFALRSCTAYINAEGEDPRYLTEETIAGKLHDWSEEGLDVRPFFAFAVAVSAQLTDVYKSDMEAILANAKSIKSALEIEIESLTGSMAPNSPAADTTDSGDSGRQKP